MIPATRPVARTVWQGGELCGDSDSIATEVAVALVYNGISHAVMMATPVDLEDFALGFSLTERILQGPDQLLDIELRESDLGVEVAMQIAAGSFAALKGRRRTLAGRTGCGLCGVESLEQVMPPAAAVTGDIRISHRALQEAAADLDRRQSLRRLTGGVHAAAWCSAQGEIELLREDVGRHNALDKLLGAARREDCTSGFVLVTSRASYEMVTKAAACNVPLLAAVSAPTSLAVDWATTCGITLAGFVQPGRQVVYTCPQRITEEP